MLFSILLLSYHVFPELNSNGLQNLPSNIFNHVTLLRSLFVSHCFIHSQLSSFSRDIGDNSLMSLPPTIFSSLWNLNSLKVKWKWILYSFTSSRVCLPICFHLFHQVCLTISSMLKLFRIEPLFLFIELLFYHRFVIEQIDTVPFKACLKTKLFRISFCSFYY